MLIRIILTILFLINLINPRLLWRLDFWCYDGEKPDPSLLYICLVRICCAIGLLSQLIYFLLLILV